MEATADPVVPGSGRTDGRGAGALSITCSDRVRWPLGPSPRRSPNRGALADRPIPICMRTDHPIWRRLSRSATAELLLTMGHLNLALTCIVTPKVDYLGTYLA